MAKTKQRKKRTQLTLKEKCDLLHGDGSWRISGIPRLKIPSFVMHNGPAGLRYVDEEAGLSLTSDRSSVCYPAPCLLACSFDAELLKEVGASIAVECAANQTNMILAPGVNIKRNPLCGRNFEYYSEDPYLSGKLAAAFVKGVQSKNVGACLKHFACYSQESYRMINDSIVDQRALHEIYLKPFEIAIKDANPWAIMASYNKINGVYASDNDYLLKDVLRKKWNYEGVVLSDWGATADYIFSHLHGLDVEMPCLNKRRTFDLMNAYRLRGIPASTLNESSQRVLKMLQKGAEMKKEKFNPEKAHDIAVKAASKSMVLLKNDGILPLVDLNEVCVIGDLARIMRFQGGGSSQVKPYKLPSFIDIINEDRSVPVPFASGYFLEPSNDNRQVVMDAVDIASSKKTAIVFLGLPPGSETEGLDKENLLLPEDQLAMLDAISEVNENIIVVLCCGGPVELPFLPKCRALLLAYLGGEGMAEAIYQILTGVVSPSGKLAETWPIHLTDVPSFGYYPGFADYSLYRESIFIGYRYYLSCDKKVNFPFGYGLSYATFKQSLSLSAKTIQPGEVVIAEITVKNTSKIASEKVVQLYAHPNKSYAFKPTSFLIGFSKMYLLPGETKEIRLPIQTSSFAHYDIETKSFVTETDAYTIGLGDSSVEIVASSTLKVTDGKCKSTQTAMPAYYNPPKLGFLLSDDSFEALLNGQAIPSPIDHKSRPFTLNSTFGDISWTWVGKKLLKSFEKKVGTSSTDPKAKAIFSMYFGTPLRNMQMIDKSYSSPNMVFAVLALANGHPIIAAFKFIFGTRGYSK